MRFEILFAVFISLVFISCSKQKDVIPYQGEQVKIDGYKKDQIWKSIEAYDEFYSPWSDKKIEKTSFKSFHNGVFLYFHFTVLDKTIYCNEKEAYPSSVEYSDRAEIFFAKDEDLSEYYGIEIDACGRMISFKSSGYRNFSKDWVFPGFSKKDFKVTQSNHGYQVEGRIQLSVLRDIGILKDQEMLIGLFRVNYFKKHAKEKVQWLSWSSIQSKNPDFHNIQGFKPVILGH